MWELNISRLIVSDPCMIVTPLWSQKIAPHPFTYIGAWKSRGLGASVNENAINHTFVCRSPSDRRCCAILTWTTVSGDLNFVWTCAWRCQAVQRNSKTFFGYCCWGNKLRATHPMALLCSTPVRRERDREHENLQLYNISDTLNLSLPLTAWIIEYAFASSVWVMIDTLLFEYSGDVSRQKYSGH